MTKNRQILLIKRPEGFPSKDVFEITEGPLPEPAEGEVLIKTLYISVDPYMRGRMRDVVTYIEPFPLNEVIVGGVVGKVIKTNSDKFKEGDFVEGIMGWQEYSAVSEDILRKLDPEAGPLSTALGILGMPGFTSYFGLLDVGRPGDGETLVVSGAAGAVGSAVGQIGKIKGCRVVGIAGSDEKIKYITEELGFDEGINYKKVKNIRKALKKACPDGVDIYFDNVGGPISDAVLTLINNRARIVICGQIALYNDEKLPEGPLPQMQLLIKRARMEGFIVFDYQENFPKAYKELAGWIKEGKLKYRESITEGFENIPDAFLGLFTGENTGKQVVRVGTD